MTRSHRPILWMLLALLVSGCGPTRDVSVGIRDVATDILLTGPKATSTAAPLIAPIPPRVPGFPFVPTEPAPTTGDHVPLPTLPDVAPPDIVALVVATAAAVVEDDPLNTGRVRVPRDASDDLDEDDLSDDIDDDEPSFL